MLKFDNVDDRLRWTTLASALANTADGAWTMCAVVKRVGASEFDAISYLLNSGGTTQAGLSFGSTNMVCDFGSSRTFTPNLNSTASPYMLAVSKGAGAATARLGYKLGSGGAWTHVAASGTQADMAAGAILDVGVWQATGDPINSWVGIIAWWEGAMSDVNKEALDDNWRTSDVWNSAHGTPTCLLECNVAAASVVDLAGNVSSSSHVGTTLDAGETLDSWNFNGTGAGATVTPPLPMVVDTAVSRASSW